MDTRLIKIQYQIYKNYIIIVNNTLLDEFMELLIGHVDDPRKALTLQAKCYNGTFLGTTVSGSIEFVGISAINLIRIG